MLNSRRPDWSSLVRVIYRASNPLRGCGARDIGGAEGRQGIGNGVGDRRKGGDGFAAAFDAKRVGRAAGAVEGEIERREITGNVRSAMW